jgi:hypothetical protein
MRERKNQKSKGATGRRGCLCHDEDIYHVDCCDEGSIYNEGIGKSRKETEQELAEQNNG